jgi:subtilisin family serine protease
VQTRTGQLGHFLNPFCGTSAAAPHVAAIAALLLQAAPGLSSQQVRDILMRTADDLGPAGFDFTYCSGRVDAFNALAAAGSSAGSSGDFELVVPLASGGLAHYYRPNNPIGPWVGPAAVFGSGVYDAVSFIQSNFGGNFEVIARQGPQLVTFFRDHSTGLWHGPSSLLASGIPGNPVLIQRE